MNIEEKNVEIICDIVNYYTKEQQVMQSIEEMSELTKELVNEMKNKLDRQKERMEEEIRNVKNKRTE